MADVEPAADEPAPEGDNELSFSGGQKVDAKIKAVFKDHSETSPLGLKGPELQSQLLKRSDHVKEWRSRYFHLHDRRIYYFECEDDAMPKDGKTFHKGYLDMVGARISEFEDEDDQGKYYGFEVLEEFGLDGDGKGCGPDQGLKLRLCSNHEDQRDKWVEAIKLAARPMWLDDKDATAKNCLSCEKKFGLTTRKSHCRRCGGVMCKSCTVPMELPTLLYEESQKCCTKCQGGEKASRYIEKIPKAKRGNKKPKAQDMAADALGNAAGKLGKAFFGGKKDKGKKK